jgi:hypothetical protein
MHAPKVNSLAMPIVVGAQRSGTTVAVHADTHPLLAIFSETGFLAPVAPQRDALSIKALQRTITTYQPDFPGWNDFGLDAELYESRLRRIDPFSVAEGVREFRS